MQRNKFPKATAMLVLTLALARTFSNPIYAETPPPDQTNTDSGGGGPIDGGAGNGGQGDAGTNQSGMSKPLQPCTNRSVPSWFPAGPPQVEIYNYPADDVYPERDYYVLRIGEYTHSFWTITKTAERMPGLSESWYDNGADPKASWCIN